MKLKQWQYIFYEIANANSIVQLEIQLKNGISKHANVNIKIIVHEKKNNYSWNPSTCICENSKYLKIIADTSVTEYDEIRFVMDIVPTKKANTIATNVTNTAPINCHSKKVRNCYILLTVLLVIIILLIFAIIM